MKYLEDLIEQLFDIHNNITYEGIKNPSTIKVKIAITDKTTGDIITTSDISAIYFDTSNYNIGEEDTLHIECLVDNIDTYYSNII